MFQAIADRKYSLLRVLGVRLQNEHQDLISALLCFDHLFSLPLNLQNASVSDMAVILEAFLLYNRGLSRIAYHRNPCQDPGFQRLFGFRESTPNMFSVHHGTLLKEALLNSRILATTEEAGVVVRGLDLSVVLTRSIHNHLLARTRNENLMCRHARAYSPCAAFTVLGECARGGECWSAHIPSNLLDADWFHCRIRIVFQQILVYQTIIALEDRVDQLKEQKCAVGYFMTDVC